MVNRPQLCEWLAEGCCLSKIAGHHSRTLSCTAGNLYQAHWRAGPPCDAAARPVCQVLRAWPGLRNLPAVASSGVQVTSASGSEHCTRKEMLVCPGSSRAQTLCYAIFTTAVLSLVLLALCTRPHCKAGLPCEHRHIGCSSTSCLSGTLSLARTGNLPGI